MARKNAIIDAALEVVGRVGIAGLSLRVVAAQAGIPLSAVGYYFEGKDDLIQEAFDRHIQHETARVTKAISRMGESPSAADELTDLQTADRGLTDTQMQLLASMSSRSRVSVGGTGASFCAASRMLRRKR